VGSARGMCSNVGRLWGCTVIAEGAGTVRKAEKVQGKWETKKFSTGPSTFVGVSAGWSDAELCGHLAKIRRTGELGAGGRESVEGIAQPSSPPIPPQCVSSSSSSLACHRRSRSDPGPTLVATKLETTLTTTKGPNNCHVPSHLPRFSAKTRVIALLG
jgi:hypothetical protein